MCNRFKVRGREKGWLGRMKGLLGSEGFYNEYIISSRGFFF